MDRLMDRTALITGTLQGIGEGAARTLARHGANLILLDISPEIEKLADKPCGRGHCCAAVVTDVCGPALVAVIIRHAKEKERRIDILVNNAGVCRPGSFLDINDNDRGFHIDISIENVWSVTRTVLPEIITRKDGRIVMVSSVAGDMTANPGRTACVLVEAAIVGLIKSLAVEYAQPSIRVNAIRPGYVHTPMAENIARQSSLENPESVLTEMAKIVSMRRLADPLEVDELAAFLASDKSSYLTGTQNVIDGGSILPETVSVGT